MKGISSVAGVQDGYSVPSGGGEQEDCSGRVCVCVLGGGGGGGGGGGRDHGTETTIQVCGSSTYTVCVCGTCNITSRNMTIRLSENV